MSISIQKGSMNDLDRLAALYDHVIDALTAEINYPGWQKGIYPTVQDAKAGLEEAALFTVIEQNQLVGSFILRHRPEIGYAKADWHCDLADEQVLVIYTLAVHPAWQNQHIGQKIIDFILQYAKQTKMQAVRLDVYEGNLPAIHLYEKMGFEYIATVDLGYGDYGLEAFKLYQYLI